MILAITTDSNLQNYIRAIKYYPQQLLLQKLISFCFEIKEVEFTRKDCFEKISPVADPTRIKSLSDNKIAKDLWLRSQLSELDKQAFIKYDGLNIFINPFIAHKGTMFNIQEAITNWYKTSDSYCDLIDEQRNIWLGKQALKSCKGDSLYEKYGINPNWKSIEEFDTPSFCDLYQITDREIVEKQAHALHQQILAIKKQLNTPATELKDIIFEKSNTRYYSPLSPIPDKILGMKSDEWEHYKTKLQSLERSLPNLERKLMSLFQEYEANNYTSLIQWTNYLQEQYDPDYLPSTDEDDGIYPNKAFTAQDRIKLSKQRAKHTYQVPFSFQPPK